MSGGWPSPAVSPLGRPLSTPGRSLRSTIRTAARSLGAPARRARAHGARRRTSSPLEVVRSGGVASRLVPALTSRPRGRFWSHVNLPHSKSACLRLMTFVNQTDASRLPLLTHFGATPFVPTPSHPPWARHAPCNSSLVGGRP